MSKWTKRSDAETVVGKLERVYVTGGFLSDGDTNIVIRPDAAHAGLLQNLHGQKNAGGTVECEVKPMFLFTIPFKTWVRSLMATTVAARGVYVEDDDHEHKTELHPLDLIMGRVTDSLNRDKHWIRALANYRGLRVDGDLFAYRYVAASDTRKSWPLFDAPPLAQTTRTSDLPIVLPPKPGPRWVPVVDHRSSILIKAEANVIGGGPDGQSFKLEVRCHSEAGDGPGVALGELAAYWKNPDQAEMRLEPIELNFGQVQPQNISSHHLRIHNIGLVPIQITVPGPGAGGVFKWSALNAVTIPPGGHRDELIKFVPEQPGDASGVWTVHANALGQHQVQLKGKGRPGIPR